MSEDISQTNTILEQYKLYVESTDRFTGYRSQANSIFVSINTAFISSLVAVLELTNTHHTYWLIIFACCTGLLINTTWYFLIKSYRNLNSGRFKIIHEIEKKLPLQIYQMEWDLLTKTNKTKHKRQTSIEQIIPMLFGLLYISLGSLSLAYYYLQSTATT